MKRIKILPLVILSLLALFSCKKEGDSVLFDAGFNGRESNVSGFSKFEVDESIVVMPKELGDYLLETVIDTTDLFFRKDTPADLLPSEGQAIVLQECEKAPFGFAGRVTSVDRSQGDRITVHTDLLGLADIFTSAQLDTSFTFSPENFVGIYDADGNPVEFEWVTDGPLPDNQTKAEDYTEGSFMLKWPFKLGPVGCKFLGYVYMSTRKDLELHWNIDSSLGKKYLYFDFQPYATMNLNAEFSVSGDLLKDYWKDNPPLFRVMHRIPIPGPIPVIIPLVTTISLVPSIKGEVKTDFTFNYSCDFPIHLDNTSGKWNAYAKMRGSDGSPIKINSFDFDGEVAIGLQFGFMVGLYSSTIGVGAHATPEVGFTLNANIYRDDLLTLNPSLNTFLRCSSDIFVIAKVFGFKLADYKLEFPKWYILSKKVFLFPRILDFSTQARDSQVNIYYKEDSDCLLYGGDWTRTGVAVFKDGDKKPFIQKEIQPYYKDNKDILYNSVRFDNLMPNTEYKAAYFANFFGHVYYGKKHDFKTSGSYRLAFRCERQSYDVMDVPVEINPSKSNSISFSWETNDYNGEPMRMNVSANYNANTMLLTGQVSFYFYEDPDQQRVDGFTLDLSSGDSGYVTCTKIIDNGACVGAVRIYMDNGEAQPAGRKSSARCLTDKGISACTIGNPNK